MFRVLTLQQSDWRNCGLCVGLNHLVNNTQLPYLQWYLCVMVLRHSGSWLNLFFLPFERDFVLSHQSNKSFLVDLCRSEDFFVNEHKVTNCIQTFPKSNYFFYFNLFFVLVCFFSVGKRLNSQSKLADSMSHAKYFISQWLLVSGKIFLLLQSQVTFSGVILSTVLNFVFFSQDGCNFMCRCSESSPTRYKVGCQSEILCLNYINGSRHKGIVSSIL